MSGQTLVEDRQVQVEDGQTKDGHTKVSVTPIKQVSLNVNGQKRAIARAFSVPTEGRSKPSSGVNKGYHPLVWLGVWDYECQ